MSKESAMALAKGGPLPTTTIPVTPAATATPEVPNAPSTAAAPTQTSADPRMQTLLKKEVDLVKQREMFNRQKQDLEQKAKSADEILGRAKQFEELKKTDPVAALKLIGYSETEIFNIMAAANEPAKTKTPEEIASETTQKLLKERDDAEAKRNAEATASANDQAVTSSIRSVLSNPENVEKFELCALSGGPAEEQIRETLFAFAEADSKEAKARGEQYVLTEEAAQKLLVEATEAVEGTYRANVKELSGTKAFTALMKELGWTKAEIAAVAAAAVPAAPVVTTTVVETPAQVAAAARTKTLTNRVSPTSAALNSAPRETQAQKRARLESVLRTGDTALLRKQ